MWQFVTVEAGEGKAASTAPALPVRVGPARPIGEVTHGLTHRRYHFAVFLCDATGDEPPPPDRPREWVSLAELARFPLPKPHVKAAEMLEAIRE